MPRPAVTTRQFLNVRHCQPAKSAIRSPTPLIHAQDPAAADWLATFPLPPLPTTGPLEERREAPSPNIFTQQRAAGELQCADPSLSVCCELAIVQLSVAMRWAGVGGVSRWRIPTPIPILRGSRAQRRMARGQERSPARRQIKRSITNHGGPGG
ncbi:hypothetical protein SRHO_G00128270 [Serrasalmus rhombeus]